MKHYKRKVLFLKLLFITKDKCFKVAWIEFFFKFTIIFFFYDKYKPIKKSYKFKVFGCKKCIFSSLSVFKYCCVRNHKKISRLKLLKCAWKNKAFFFHFLNAFQKRQVLCWRPLSFYLERAKPFSLVSRRRLISRCSAAAKHKTLQAGRPAQAKNIKKVKIEKNGSATTRAENRGSAHPQRELRVQGSARKRGPRRSRGAGKDRRDQEQKEQKLDQKVSVAAF